MIDLHTHSTVSDGSETPERVVELAAEVGCSALSLTDHDSLEGLPAARARAAQLGLRLVPGCEISCLPSPLGGGVHVLVYFVDDSDSPLGGELEALRGDRAVRNAALLDRLADLGVHLAWEDVVAVAGSEAGVGRPHFAQAMVDAGAVGDTTEAFDVWLGNSGRAYVPKARLSVADVCRLARESGGVAVLAHPTTSGLVGPDLAAWVAELAEQGLGGLEAVYGRYSPRQRTDLVNLARRFGLVATGGSDFHGSHKADIAVGTGTGDLTVPDRVLDELEGARPSRGG